MQERFFKGLAAGAIIGAVAGMTLMPNMDRRAQRKLKKSYRTMKDSAEDVYNNIVGWVK